MHETFDEWFEAFKKEVASLNYHGPIDKDSFQDDFDNDVDPGVAAEEFVKEMNS